MPRAVLGDPNENTRESDRFLENGILEFVPPCTAKLEGKVKVLIGTAE